VSDAPPAEHVQARLALQGLDPGNAPEPRTPLTRTWDGPPDPDRLLAYLGFEGFRPGQREAVEAALAGRDSLIVMPTGGGKSLCYQLPGLATADLTVVVSPLIALMADQWQKLAGDGHPVAMLASGLGADVMRATLDRVTDGTVRIVYCSPERFGSTSFLTALAARRVDLFAVDEAHCVSEWGHDFRPDYLRLPQAIDRLGRPAVMACTATATPDVAAEISRRLGLHDPLTVRSGFDRPNLSFDIVRFEGAGSKARKLALLEAGLADAANRPAIVYCGTRRDTDEVAGLLREAGVEAVGYHAGMEPDERAAAQHRFMAGDAKVVVATNAFGMGVDKADVRSVWHWAIPTSVEAYYQEAGRAGRDGLPARAVLLAGRADLSRLVYFNERRTIEPEQVGAYLARLRAASEDADSVVIEPPRDEDARIRLAIAERAGACAIEPAPAGRLQVTFHGQLNRALVGRECQVARDRGWRAYRAVKEFAFADGCRRRQLLDHFGDPSPTAPTGRCCDACEPSGWLPDPDTLPVRRRRTRSTTKDAAPVELAAGDEPLFERLRTWRREAASGKPAYTVAHDATLRAIASTRPASSEALGEIRGIGPAFVSRHADAVLAIVAGDPALEHG
jgi:ATP-dependent DNA helicase RecQ